MKDKPLLVEAGIYVHAYDVDAMGYVSNIVYIRWFEDMRHHLLDVYYPFEKMIEDGKSPVLMHTDVDYLQPLTIHDKPTGRCWMEKAGGTKWILRYEIVQGDTVHCSGIQKGYFMDLSTQRPVKLPQNMLDAFRAAVEE
ncbi:MAG: acyl-CoA thioesterase [Bacteroidetes bacterium]|nr:acyl-CoA thioesterase [Bacteroidota bacterium]